MLGNLLDKTKKEKHEEVLQWAAFKQFCTDSESFKQGAVKAADLRVEVLQASVQKDDADVDRLGREIQVHETDIAGYKSDLNSSNVERQRQHEDYQILHKDYSESIDAIQDAIRVLQAQAHDRPQVDALLQKVGAHSVLPVEARRVIEAFLSRNSEEPDLAFVAPPEANAYEFQSNSIMEMLKELLDKFESELRALEKQELEEHHAQELLAHSLAKSVAIATHEIAQKTTSRGTAKQASVNANADLTAVSTQRASDAKYLDELNIMCSRKAEDLESRQKLRTEEIAAIEKAMAILSSEGVSGVAEKHLPAILQRAHATAFVQRRTRPQSQNQHQDQERAAVYLREASERLGSRALSALAARVQDDPFIKVKKMVQDLITRLQEEAADEEQHQGWCNTELSTNEQTRKDKTTLAETLQQTIEGLKTGMAILSKDISVLSGQVADLQATLAAAQKLRSDERTHNEQAIADAAAAQVQVAQAIQLLQDFYSSAATAVALTQHSQHGVKQAPPIFNSTYQGQQTDGHNIIAFLQVVKSDFERLESGTSSSEQAASHDYDAMVVVLEADKEVKNKAIETKQGELTTKGQDLQLATHNLEMAKSELQAAWDYYDKLRPSCLNSESGTTSVERVQRREEEIQSLREALAILSGEPALSSR